jgi:hypothetical protein
LCEFEPLVTEFDKLPKRIKPEAATHIFGKIKTLERG